MKFLNRKPTIIFFGTPTIGVQVLEKLITKGFKPIAVVTREDKPVGRGQKPTPPPVKIIAQKYQITIFQPKKLKENSEITSNLQSLSPDLFIVAAYGRIIPKENLEIPRYGTLNIHPSILPKYRGASPIQSAILAGEKETGVTIILLDEEMDHGLIVAQEKIDLAETETAEDLRKKLGDLGAELLAETIPKYLSWRGTAVERIAPRAKPSQTRRAEPVGRAGGRWITSEVTRSDKIFYFPPKPQNHAKAIYTKILTKEDGQIDLKNPPPPEKLNRMIRAFYPWPGVWVRWQIANSKWQMVKFLPNNPFLVQLEGKKPMTVKAFLNGHPQAKEFFFKLESPSTPSSSA